MIMMNDIRHVECNILDRRTNEKCSGSMAHLEVYRSRHGW